MTHVVQMLMFVRRRLVGSRLQIVQRANWIGERISARRSPRDLHGNQKQDTQTRRIKMYQSARLHAHRLCCGLTGVCLLMLFAVSRAKAGPLPPPPPVPLAPFVLNGTLFLNLTPRVDFVDFGHYSLFQPEPGPFEGDSRMLFTAFGGPPFLGTEIDAGKFQFGRATATLSYE